MSWFARTIANTLNLEDDDEEDNNNATTNQTKNEAQTANDSSPPSPGRGVKEDLSELTTSVTRQLWGVASFLAPPPSSSKSNPDDPEESDPQGILGIRNDFAEIGGRFRSGISKLSTNMASVSEITTKMASNFLQLGSDDEERDYDGSPARGAAIGVTDGVVAFARDISMHPETWLDFPLPDIEGKEDFDMSDAQQEHALVVERLVPRLAALRMELCPGYMSETFFWKIYFILLHPRLEQHDAEVLSTPQIMDARALLTPNNKKQTREQGWSSKDVYLKDATNSQNEECLSVISAAQSESVPIQTTACESVTSPLAAVPETEKHPVIGNEIPVIDKSVIKEGNVNPNEDKKVHIGSSSDVVNKNNEDDADDWLKEESSEMVGSSRTIIPIDNDEDVSFSDLEEDEGDVSTKDSRDWVQLSRSSADSI